MLVTLEGIVISLRLLHPEKALPSILVTPSGKFISTRFVQPLNAPLLMTVTLEGSVISLRLLSSLKALKPILVTVNSWLSYVTVPGTDNVRISSEPTYLSTITSSSTFVTQYWMSSTVKICAFSDIGVENIKAKSTEIINLGCFMTAGF